MPKIAVRSSQDASFAGTMVRAAGSTGPGGRRLTWSLWTCVPDRFRQETRRRDSLLEQCLLLVRGRRFGHRALTDRGKGKQLANGQTVGR